MTASSDHKDIGEILDEYVRQNDHADKIAAGKAILYVRTHQISQDTAEHLKKSGSKVEKGKYLYPNGALTFEDFYWMAKAVSELQEHNPRQTSYLDNPEEFTRIASGGIETNPTTIMDLKKGVKPMSVGILTVSVERNRRPGEDENANYMELIVDYKSGLTESPFDDVPREIVGIIWHAGLVVDRPEWS